MSSLSRSALIALAWLLSQLVRLALSRSRELLADAGSVELTKNPDAMISALRKIENRGELPGATSAVMELCVDNPREGFADLFATHPSVESRVQALVKYRRRTRSRTAGPAVGYATAGRSADSRQPVKIPPPLPSGPWSDARILPALHAGARSRQPSWARQGPCVRPAVGHVQLRPCREHDLALPIGVRAGDRRRHDYPNGGLMN